MFSILIDLAETHTHCQLIALAKSIFFIVGTGYILSDSCYAPLIQNSD
jgi:hypothetical protein